MARGADRGNLIAEVIDLGPRVPPEEAGPEGEPETVAPEPEEEPQEVVEPEPEGPDPRFQIEFF